ncbi:MAG: FeoB-associated Cys-rich membrane protein [Lachnospiraceae bacterium]|nr:FeoB-associated Cys-rich membrane protein [Lachnospiraceae bacterium]MBQ6091155.1 FeoB-associated Cys-rich membrane protein [Lachnospiraceae bacterium]MBR5368301.1 FeoB-associated Cys-rich membrane protein [Lachnospiraceae bacterium]
MNWFTDNLGTIAVAAVLIVIVAFTIRYVVKHKSKSLCGGDCAHCKGCATCTSGQKKC